MIMLEGSEPHEYAFTHLALSRDNANFKPIQKCPSLTAMQPFSGLLFTGSFLTMSCIFLSYLGFFSLTTQNFQTFLLIKILRIPSFLPSTPNYDCINS